MGQSLGTTIRQVDSSLLDEWEKMRDPNYRPGEAKEARPPGAEEAASDITRDVKGFTAAIRNRIFMFLRGVAMGDYEPAIAGLNSTVDGEDQPWTASRLEELMKAYHADHEHICLDPDARNARHTYVLPSEDKKTWRVQQMLVGCSGRHTNDQKAEFEVDLAGSRSLGEPMMRLRRLGNLTER